MRKLSLFTFVMLLTVSAHADDSGSCGENVTYVYTEDTHTLTISGTGEMSNESSNYKGWAGYRNDIQKIVIEAGVTSIGKYAFFGCKGLKSVSIPTTILTINDQAFYGCDALPSISIPNSVTSLGMYAFNDCTSLTSIIIPSSVTSIEADAFLGCTGLTSVTISDGVTSIGNYAFSYSI